LGLNNKKNEKIEDKDIKQISEQKLFKEDDNKNNINIIGSKFCIKKTSNEEVDANDVNKSKINLIQDKNSSKKGLSILDILKNKNKKI